MFEKQRSKGLENLEYFLGPNPLLTSEKQVDLERIFLFVIIGQRQPIKPVGGWFLAKWHWGIRQNRLSVSMWSQAIGILDKIRRDISIEELSNHDCKCWKKRLDRFFKCVAKKKKHHKQNLKENDKPGTRIWNTYWQAETWTFVFSTTDSLYFIFWTLQFLKNWSLVDLQCLRWTAKWETFLREEVKIREKMTITLTEMDKEKNKQRIKEIEVAKKAIAGSSI